jgi:hypothetical protein
VPKWQSCTTTVALPTRINPGPWLSRGDCTKGTSAVCPEQANWVLPWSWLSLVERARSHCQQTAMPQLEHCLTTPPSPHLTQSSVNAKTEDWAQLLMPLTAQRHCKGLRHHHQCCSQTRYGSTTSVFPTAVTRKRIGGVRTSWIMLCVCVCVVGGGGHTSGRVE